MKRAAAALAASLLAFAAAPVAAQPAQVSPPGATVVERLALAASASEGKQWASVLELLRDVPHDRTVPAADRAEAHRLLGIAEFHLAHYDRAETHFLAYLELDLDGQLDIGLHAPDVVRFFDDVKAKHAAHLRALRPRPRTRRYAVLNLVPPAGQFQNREPVKGWVLGGLGVALLATNVGTYMMLDRWCHDANRTCESDGESRSDDARRMKTLNTAAGVALIGLYAYGVYDGFRSYRARGSVTVAPVAFSTAHGGGLGVAGSF